jgi:hypothetical protein
MWLFTVREQVLLMYKRLTLLRYSGFCILKMSSLLHKKLDKLKRYKNGTVLNDIY